MGVSGWVESLPVLVGNRMMLKTHGCAMPSKDYEHLLTGGDNRSLVYIAISGVPCAVLLVKYSADGDTINSVQRMVESGVSLVIYTCGSEGAYAFTESVSAFSKAGTVRLSTGRGSLQKAHGPAVDGRSTDLYQLNLPVLTHQRTGHKNSPASDVTHTHGLGIVCLDANGINFIFH